MAMSTKRICTSLSISIAAVFLALSLCLLPLAGFSGEDACASPGSGWEDQSMGYFAATKHGLTAVDADTAWVVGRGGTILKTSDGGGTWAVQHSDNTSTLQDVAAADASNAWAVGWNGTILHTNDGGENWVTQRTGTEPLQAVCAVDTNTAWVAGMEYPTHMNRFILKTEDGGATWVRQGMGSGYGLNDISAVDSSVAWTIGSAGTVSKTTDGGTTWTQLDTTTEYGSSIVAMDEMRAWVVGYNGTIKRTEDGGDTWTTQDSGTTASLASLSAVDSDTAWAVGSGGAILKTSDGGDTWQSQGTATTDLNAVFAVDSSTAWAVGDGGVVLKTEDGGATWVSQIDTTPYTNAKLTSISAVDADTAWAAGEGVLLKTIDGGASWNKVYESATMTITGVCAADENNIWTVGREGSSSSGTSFVYKTADGGASWSLQYYLPASTSSFTGVSAVDAQTAWVVGSGGTILKTSNGGATWAAQPSGTTAYFTSVCAVDAQTAWISGWSKAFVPYWGYNVYYRFPPLDQAPSLPIIMKTSNGGASWAAKQIGSWDEGYHEISAPDGSSAIAVGNDVIYSPIPGYDVTPGMLGYLYLIALGTNAVTVTHDGGNTWAYLGTNIDPYDLYSVSMVDANTAWAVGTGGLIVKTTDGGTTWTPQATGLYQHLNSISAVDASTAWSVGDFGTILKTTDGGDARPDILSISPDTGDVGSYATISGCDFGITQDSSYVTFGTVTATEYASWSDDEITARVPAGVVAKVQVTVTTPAGVSNRVPFIVPFAPATVTSIIPNQVMQNTVSLEITDLAGSGFQPGATVRLEKGTAVINAYNVNVVSGNKITCTIGFLGVEAGVYDVVVTNPDTQEARLTGGFTVTSQCGTGSGTALLLLGLSLGLLSLAGTANLRKRKKK